MQSNSLIGFQTVSGPFSNISANLFHLLSKSERDEMFKDHVQMMSVALGMKSEEYLAKKQTCPHSELLTTYSLYGFQQDTKDLNHIFAKHQDCCELCTVKSGCK
jgi:predicted transcriptional regulator